VVVGLGGASTAPRALLDAGVQRISTGGSIARAALGFVAAHGRALHEHGSIEFASLQLSQLELNTLFAASLRRRVDSNRSRA